MFRIIFLAVVITAVAAFTSQNIIVEDEPDASCIKRPCSLNDNRCIKREFTKRGLCDKVKTYPFQKGELTVKNFTVNHPYFNCTATQNACIKGLEHGKVAEFYINEKTGLAVFSVKYDNVVVEGDLVVNFYRKLKEDMIVRHDTYEEYSGVIATTIIPTGKCFKDNIRTTIFFTEKPYVYAGDLCEIKNPEIRNLYSSIFNNINIVTTTTFSFRAPIVQRAFVENVICC